MNSVEGLYFTEKETTYVQSNSKFSSSDLLDITDKIAIDY